MWKKMCLGYNNTMCVFATKLNPLTHEMKIFFDISVDVALTVSIQQNETGLIKLGKWEDIFKVTFFIWSQFASHRFGPFSFSGVIQWLKYHTKAMDLV